MENENPLSIINRNLPSTDTEQAEAMLDSVVNMNWIPSLSICYAVSKSFKNKIAMPGEFVLAGQTNLSSKINMLVLDFRIHTVICNLDDQTFESEIYHLSTDGDLKDNKEYTAFCNQTLPAKTTKNPKGHELQKGVDLFIYLPEQACFCSMFCKKSLAQAGGQLEKAGAGGRLLEISTIANEGKRGDWYSLNIVPKDHAAVGSGLAVGHKDIALPVDKFTKYHTLFINPVKGVETTDEGNTERVR